MAQLITWFSGSVIAPIAKNTARNARLVMTCRSSRVFGLIAALWNGSVASDPVRCLQITCYRSCHNTAEIDQHARPERSRLLRNQRNDCSPSLPQIIFETDRQDGHPVAMRFRTLFTPRSTVPLLGGDIASPLLAERRFSYAQGPLLKIVEPWSIRTKHTLTSRTALWCGSYRKIFTKTCAARARFAISRQYRSCFRA